MYTATIDSVANLPTEFGEFRLVSFALGLDEKEHVAIIRGDLRGRQDVPVRIHSECLTGDALASLRCDCRGQLHLSLAELGQAEFGAVLYLRQEGRGIGLRNKVRAYTYQDGGMDTVEANLALGFEDDLRDYGIAAAMLRGLGVQSVRLKTNNPDKVAQLHWYGIDVTHRVPHEVSPNEHNHFYLETKRRRSGHALTLGNPVAAK